MVHCVYTFLGALAQRNFVSCRIHFALFKSCVLLYWHLSSGRQPNFVAWYKEWNYGTFADGATYIRLGGHHVGHRPAF